MKKYIVLSLILLTLLITAGIGCAIYVGFTTIGPTTKAINKELSKYFGKVVYIPTQIPPPSQDFAQTIYTWEMETPDKETVGMNFSFNPAFEKNQDHITAVLVMEEKGDASIFNKVMPAVIFDSKSFIAARNPQEANLSASPEAGYTKINLALNQKGQTTKISWDFNKSSLPPQLTALYKKLDVYPLPVLKFLYSLPNFVLSLAAG